MEIRLIKQEEIDRLKWNSCVHYANNGHVYGYKWFLDAVAKDWDGLVEGDYESVFPLTWSEDFLRRKILHQPALIRESGLYSVHLLSKARTKAFLDAIPETYRRIKINLNEQNSFPDLGVFDWQEKKNHQLLLNQPYETLRQNYSAELIDTLKKAEAAELIPNSSLRPEALAAFYEQHSVDKRKAQHVHTFQRIMYNALHRGIGFITGVQSRSEELLAVNFFVSSHGKLLSLLPVESPQGKAVHALDHLIDVVVRMNAGKPSLLDFNAADMRWKHFGALPNTYFGIEKTQKLFGLF